MIFYPHSLEWLGDCCRLGMLVLVLIFSIAPMCLSAEPVLPVLTTDTSLASAGYYQLSWQPGVAGSSNKNIKFELQQATSTSFLNPKTIYRGSDRARVFSGLTDGEYYYRVRMLDSRQPASDWSRSIVVTVQHHSLTKALGFFLAGAGVFFITLLFIVIQARRIDGA